MQILSVCMCVVTVPPDAPPFFSLSVVALPDFYFSSLLIPPVSSYPVSPSFALFVWHKKVLRFPSLNLASSQQKMRNATWSRPLSLKLLPHCCSLPSSAATREELLGTEDYALERSLGLHKYCMSRPIFPRYISTRLSYCSGCYTVNLWLILQLWPSFLKKNK